MADQLYTIEFNFLCKRKKSAKNRNFLKSNYVHKHTHTRTHNIISLELNYIWLANREGEWEIDAATNW